MIKLVVVGKLKEKALLMLMQEYKKRLTSYTKLEIIEVADEQAPQTNSQAQNEQVKEKEGERILSKIREKEYVILLDIKGDIFNSEQFAKTLEKVQLYQSSEITFVIGGSLGISNAVIQRANMRWKLSDLTFPHPLVRVLLLEQIYRSYKIRYHEPYHK